MCELISQGFSNGVIAEKMGISPHTVKTHLRNIYSKSCFKNRTNLALNFKEKK